MELTLEDGLHMMCATGARPIIAMPRLITTASLPLLMRVRGGVGGIYAIDS